MEAKKKNVPSFDVKGFFSKENYPLLCLIFLGIFAVVAIVVSIIAFSINPVIACVMVILEAALAATLNKIPLWIHGLVFIAQIVCGIMASQVPFMLFMAFIYVFSTVFLYIWANK
ncbi:hypothetical protein SAMN04487830_10113 [Pseudobutyrivibrio sp. OR37]|uniref:hypothetical protein n=1 Tax=Pseudobutyrivibrio sp. OR37 TaxID=1798186 RepID=UPI0008ECA89B|nr:hypothetical protein [Pseudobutyrivibrio sp. OR37]SFH51793.1 hypothetical protein SAMN04487830_10113 [Pseudobutyrivibrio sp. OR37]